ncbi:histone-lysine N-methyltransferase [Plectosphaerella plurivora]|uniref:Histone-lysine N-methyltransferase, H3 lysine-79 specific n=1 Tax=Plectosphaerella plurivora TaxID=936078 RepID=A0A9P8V413_9PEZI|nr:histone-lysine N-methyltransferase [Plectosphaerella plurivora]
MPLLSSKAKKPPTIRIEKVAIRRPPPPKPRPSLTQRTTSTSSAKASPRPSPNPRLLPRESASPYPSSSEERRRKRKLGSVDPVTQWGKDDSDSDGADDDFVQNLDMAKRQRRADSERTDERRSLVAAEAFEGHWPKELKYIHARSVMNTSSPAKPAKRALKARADDDIRVRIQYPSVYLPESYELLVENGTIDAVSDILQVVNQVAYFYLTEEQAKPFTDQENGLIRRLERTSRMNELAEFKLALKEANGRIRRLAQDGTFRKNLDRKHGVPRDLVEFILAQVYDRTVSPDVEKLKQYTNGTDNVYGELKHVFISKILQEKTHMTSDQVFVDLGSGVGNVVFQAALEIGCESWGCEMMDNPCDFAVAQQDEFEKRCRLWGLSPGKVSLVRGDFLKDESIHAALKRADVVLVNNQAFTPQLNDKLAYMFLDLKSGCKIVSLKSFLHADGVRNTNDVVRNILDVEQNTFPEDYVSWTNNGGEFYVSTRK